ncbi:MAG: hypothetical protein M3Z95_06465, partial [Actinomycetota bacterium]|nr:hypothetical protein [Actinomycetota bacterium]
MDPEMASTLGELERKLQELERALTAIGRGGSAGAGEADPDEQTDVSSQQPGGDSPQPDGAGQRAEAAAAPDDGHGWLIDEAIEREGSAHSAG